MALERNKEGEKKTLSVRIFPYDIQTMLMSLGDDNIFLSIDSFLNENTTYRNKISPISSSSSSYHSTHSGNGFFLEGGGGCD